ncbi:MAG: sulfatase-like hydrolase/transferase [Paludibacter sp.]|nr:sulfatase-like hydrolase/transferase [Paludibacter sp.]
MRTKNIASFLALSLPIASLSALDANKPKNVLLIMADDMGAMELGCYGSPLNLTPNFDALASSGVQVNTFFATPVSTPTRVALMSGKYGTKTGHLNMAGSPGGKGAGYSLATEEYTFGQMFKDAGYTTAMAGKWQLSGTMPNMIRECGFDEYMWWISKGDLPKGDPYLGGYQPGSDKISRFWHPGIGVNGVHIATEPTDYGPDMFSNFLIDFMSRNAAEEQPFFAYYPMALIHTPWESTPDAPGLTTNSPAALKANVEYCDKIIGRLIKALEDAGIRENTLVIFIGDNGTQKMGKTTITEWGPRTPCLVSCPGYIPGNRVSNELVDVTDILKTITDFAGFTPSNNADLDGVSMMPYLLQDVPTHKELAMSFYGQYRVLREREWLLEANSAESFGDLYYCGDKRSGLGYELVKNFTLPEVIAAKARFDGYIRDYCVDPPMTPEERTQFTESMVDKRATLLQTLAVKFNENYGSKIYKAVDPDIVQLGDYHFNSSSDFFTSAYPDYVFTTSIQRGGTNKWTVSYPNGIYTALSTGATNFNQTPLFLTIKTNSTMQVAINRIEIIYRLNLTSNATFSLVHTTNATDKPADLSPFAAAGTFTENVTPGFTGEYFTFEPVVIDANSDGYILHFRIRDTVEPGGSKIEIDHVKILGEIIDPNATTITVPDQVVFVGAVPLGENIEMTVPVATTNTTSPIQVTSSSPNFTASWNNSPQKGVLINFTPSDVGFVNAVIELSHNGSKYPFNVKGWGLKSGTIAAWNFNGLSMDADYFLNEAPLLTMVGESEPNFIDKGGDQLGWMLEINNLYTLQFGNEVPDISGIEISNLNYAGRLNMSFDIQARNSSPNTMKLGHFNESGIFDGNAYVWKNPRGSLGVESVNNLEFEIQNGELRMVSTFDPDTQTPSFKTIKQNPPVEFNNSTGWAFDNIMIKPVSTATDAGIFSRTNQVKVSIENGYLRVNNIHVETKMDIYSMHGKLLQSHVLNRNALLAAEFDKGIYIIRFINESGVSAHKIILN